MRWRLGPIARQPFGKPPTQEGCWVNTYLTNTRDNLKRRSKDMELTPSQSDGPQDMTVSRETRGQMRRQKRRCMGIQVQPPCYPRCAGTQCWSVDQWSASHTSKGLGLSQLANLP